MVDVEPVFAAGMRPVLQIVDLGLVPYVESWDLQRQYAAERAADRMRDTLLLLEHPHTYTFGSRGKPEHLLVPREELAGQGIAVLNVDRGGDITYHGPGQLVVYPILRLREYGLGIVQYLRALESVLIRLCDRYGIAAQRVRGYTGAWIGDAKVAAIGAKVDVNGVTRHGCALNVTTDLRYFDKIVPCGIYDKGVTSLAQVLGRPVVMAEVKVCFEEAFREVFAGAAAGECAGPAVNTVALHD